MSSSIVDHAALLDRVDGDLEFLEETVELLESDGRQLVEELRSASEAGDQDALVKKAHALKGMVSNFCAETVQREAEEIEYLARDGTLEEIPEKVGRFVSSFDLLCLETRAIASGGKP